jgi:phosphoenolpyruvate carboxykinase (ATP)
MSPDGSPNSINEGDRSTMTSDAESADILNAARAGRLHWNLVPAQLVTMAIQRGEARLSAEGSLVAETGSATGRSPEDKYITDHAEIGDTIDWGKANKRMAPATFAALRLHAQRHLAGKTLFVQDLWAGADPGHRLAVRVITEQAWHSLFARNMFIRPPQQALGGFAPDWTVLQLPSLEADPMVHGTRSGTVVALDFAARLVLIMGTAYAGEIKKSIFSVLNYLLPARGILPMHCSANEGAAGDVAVFFGLSGTGKTTLSADPERTLIGDDEHGWSESGVFNFEGGCYAKVIRLDPRQEPEIFAASTRFGTILENVVLDPVTAATDFDDATLTENTRSSYPLDFIPNASATGRGGHPKNIVMLTCDAFGVLPPISRLSPEAAMYHFLSGYTARVAGTERGVTTPQATFSACFGAPFMARHPTVYAELLGEMMRRHAVTCWLVNTGWTGGAAGTGERMPLPATRALLHAALDGTLAKAEFRSDPVFGLAVPTSCPGVETRLLNPRDCWADPAAYATAAHEVAGLFAANFAKFKGKIDSTIEAGAIRAAA